MSVLDECGDGDPSAVAERLDAIKPLELFATSPQVDK
jgi:hypothetical protein